MHCSSDISSQYTSCVYAASNNNWEHEKPKPNKGDPLKPWAQKFRNRGGTSKIDSPRRIADPIFQANVLAVCTQPASNNVKIRSVSVSAGSLYEPFRLIFASWRNSLWTFIIYCSCSHYFLKSSLKLKCPGFNNFSPFFFYTIIHISIVPHRKKIGALLEKPVCWRCLG